MLRLTAVLLVLLTACPDSSPGPAASTPDAVVDELPQSDAVQAADSAPDADANAVTDTAPEVTVDVVEPPPERPFRAPTFVEASGWVLALGDIHGDLDSAREALQLAGALDADDHWIAGNAVVVQVGDQLDRGDDERAILDLFEQVADEAFAAGGGFYPLLGNHETMNVEFDFRYVTPGGWADFADIVPEPGDTLVTDYPPEEQGRVAAFRPGGPYARILARHNTVQVVNDTVFVHGGLLPNHLDYGLEAINADTSAWMLGEAPEPTVHTESDSPVWSRHYSDETDIADCLLLEEVLAEVGATRMVVAHTVQSFGINSACGDMVWRVDVGLADYYGGPTQVLGIQNGEVIIFN